jgi:hypothetical protein
MLPLKQSLTLSRPSTYWKVNTNRQTRHEAREQRRYGNWDILGIPTSLLWLDAAFAVAALEIDELAESEVIFDLWP